METFKHMEGFNTQTHLIHNHSKVSEKRHGIHLLHTDHITYYCIEVSAPSPQRPAEDTYSSFLQGSHPWVPPPDHGGTTQNIPEVVSNRYSGLEDRFPLLILRWHFRMCSCTPELVGWEEKSDFFFLRVCIAHILEGLRAPSLLFTAFSRRAAEEKLLISFLW